jgi:hypothetical protein
MNSSASGVAMSFPPELSTREGRQRWLRDARRRLDERRAEEARPVPRSRAKRLLEARRRLEEELEVERRANAEYEAYRARGVMKDGRRFGGPPKPYEPPEVPAAESTSPIRTRAISRRRAGGAGLQRPSGNDRVADRDRRRGDDRLTGLRASRVDGRRNRA